MAGRSGERWHPSTLSETSFASLGASTTTASHRLDLEGWADEDRTFGPVYCYPASADSESVDVSDARVIVPERTTHDGDKLGVIAPVRLRDALVVDVGDDETVRVE